MALPKEAKNAAVKSALGELIKMLGSVNMDRARKRKMSAGEEMMADEEEAPEEDAEIEEESAEGEIPIDDSEEEIDAAAEEALPPRFRKKLKRS